MGEIDTIESHIERLACLVRNATLRRVLHETDPDPQLNFWRVTYGSLTDMTVIEWCKTFGNDNEDNHWKNLVSDPKYFRSGMLEQLEIDRAEWDVYWHEMKTYRDNVAAHASNKPEISHYPSFDIALKSAFYYYDYLINQLREHGFEREPNDLRSYVQNFEVQAKKVAQAALKATADIRERVY